MSIQSFNKAHETLSAFENNVPVLGVVGSIAQILVTIAEIFAKNVLHMDVSSYNDPKDYLKSCSLNILSGGLLLPILKVITPKCEKHLDTYTYQNDSNDFPEVPYTKFVEKVLPKSTLTPQKLYEKAVEQVQTNRISPLCFGTTAIVNDPLKDFKEFQNVLPQLTQEDRLEAVPYREYK